MSAETDHIVNQESDSEKRGPQVGTLQSGERVYDRPPQQSHLLDHPEIIPLIGEALAKTPWPAERVAVDRPDQYMVEMLPLEVSLGKSNVAPVPLGDQYEIVYAPRLDHNRQPRLNPDGSFLYSRWVKGLSDDQLPERKFIKVVMNKPLAQTEDTEWVQIISAFPTADNAPQEAGGSFVKFPQHKNGALAYWEGIGVDGNPVDSETRGHAFVYDELALAGEYITHECPYDKTPNQ